MELHAYAVDAKAAVSSYLGMTMTISLAGQQVSFTVRDTETADRRGGTDGTGKGAAASLLIPHTP
jgi:hypothetical protein